MVNLTKMFSDLYQTKFLDSSAKLFFSYWKKTKWFWWLYFWQQWYFDTYN